MILGHSLKALILFSGLIIFHIFQAHSAEVDDQSAPIEVDGASTHVEFLRWLIWSNRNLEINELSDLGGQGLIPLRFQESYRAFQGFSKADFEAVAHQLSPSERILLRFELGKVAPANYYPLELVSEELSPEIAVDESLMPDFSSLTESLRALQGMEVRKYQVQLEGLDVQVLENFTFDIKTPLGQVVAASLMAPNDLKRAYEQLAAEERQQIQQRPRNTVQVELSAFQVADLLSFGRLSSSISNVSEGFSSPDDLELVRRLLESEAEAIPNEDLMSIYETIYEHESLEALRDSDSESARLASQAVEIGFNRLGAAVSALEPAEQIEFIYRLQNRNELHGSPFLMIQAYITYRDQAFFINLLKSVDDGDFVDRLLSNLSSASLQQVEYEAESRSHQYKDPQLEKSVQILAALFRHSSDVLRGQDLFQDDRNGVESEDRIEAIDLLATKLNEDLKRLLHDSGSLAEVDHRVGLGLMKAVLQNEDESPLAIFKSPDGRELVFVCGDVRSEIISPFGKAFPSRDDEGYLDELVRAGFEGVSVLYMDLDEASESQIFEAAWICGDRLYTVNSAGAVESAGSLPMQPDLNFESAFQDGRMNVLASFAILDHFSESSLNEFIAFMTLNGFTPKSRSAVDNVTDLFKEKFVNSDVYIPAAHVQNMNRFDLGQVKGTLVEFESQVDNPRKPEELLTISFDIIFPPLEEVSTTADATLNQFEIARLLCARRDIRNDPLAVMNLSCDSAAEVGNWMRAYRRSLFNDEGEMLIDPKDARDVPIVIATAQSFSTKTPADLVSHMQLGLIAVRDMAAGKSIEDVLKALSAERDPSVLLGMLKMLRGEAADAGEGPELVRYQPVCNTDDQFSYLFDLSKTSEIWVKSNSNPEKQLGF